jgi:hypothetical protein
MKNNYQTTSAREKRRKKHQKSKTTAPRRSLPRKHKKNSRETNLYSPLIHAYILTHARTPNTRGRQTQDDIKQKKNSNTKLEKLTKHGVGRVHGDLVLSSVTNEALRIRERNITRRRPVSLVVGNDLNAIMLPDSDATVGSAEIDTNRRTFALSGHGCTQPKALSKRNKITLPQKSTPKITTIKEIGDETERSENAAKEE